MPKKVFFTLDEDRKQELIDSSYNVFSKNQCSKLSINDITKELNITRTAFYYYFYNKEDLYSYLVELIKDKFLSEYIYDKEQKYDLDDIFIQLFNFLSSLKDTKYQNFLFDLFYNISFTRQNKLLTKLFKGTDVPYSHFTGFDKYNMKSFDEVKEITIIIFEITFHQLIDYYEGDLTIEESVERLKRKIYLINYGIKKGELNE